ncbi:MAG: hypothetical protein HY056_07070 [Proteobacteria bacterium]|nr:hypothetical protein [Pseudomonadota bacterium]
MLADEIDATFAFLGIAKRLSDTGKLYVLALTTRRRSPAWPNLPTMIETGFPGFEHNGFVGLTGPAKMPSGIVSGLNTELNAVASQPDFRDRFAAQGMQPPPGKNSPEDFTQFIKDQVAMHGEPANWPSRRRRPDVGPAASEAFGSYLMRQLPHDMTMAEAFDA